MEAIVWINYLLSALFLACYGYQFFYMFYALLFPQKTAPIQAAPSLPAPSGKRYALLICARNEEAVIGDLLESVRAQSYPQALLEAFVAADNCSDLTALIARQQGATVYERFDTAKVGKGYALQFLLSHIWKDRGQDAFDGYFILDADNLLSPDFVARMDETFSRGHRIVTGYRASKNYGENWISAGYALWFLRESRFLNGARMGLGTSCTVNGTGFLIHKDVLLKTAAGTTSCSPRMRNLARTACSRGSGSPIAPKAFSSMSSPFALPSPGGNGCAGARGIFRSFAPMAAACSGGPSRPEASPVLT